MKWYLLAWLVLVPIPSALAGQGTHPVRNISMIIPIILFISLGFDYIVRMKNKFNFRTASLLIIIALFLIQSFSFMLYYFRDYSRLFPHVWGFNERAAANIIKQYKMNNESVFVNDTYNVVLSFFAFETSMPPHKLQNAILKPQLINNVPLKNIDNVFFISSEEVQNQELLFNISGGVYFDAIDYIRSSSLEVSN